MKLDIYTDGAARGNPGPAGVGVVILDSTGNIKKELSEYIGEETNNVAEYQAIIAGLKSAKEFAPDIINIFSDSQLVIRQLTGEYRVRSQRLKPYYKQAKNLLNCFSDYNLQHIGRENNQEADRLANIGVDQAAQNKDKPEINPEKLVSELKKELNDFEITPDLKSVIAEMQTRTDLSRLNKEESLKEGIIFGLMLADRIN